MKKYTFWTLAFLMLSWLLGFFPISLAEEEKWKKKANIPTARMFLSTEVVNGRIYAIGGFKPGGSEFSNVEEYDPKTDKWTKKADMPTARWELSASVINGKIYAIGGTSSRFVSLSTVEEYEPISDTWTKKADMPTARDSLSTSAVNGKIYTIGGAHQDSQGSTPSKTPTKEVYSEEALIGHLAPDFHLPDLSGKEVKLSDFSGNYS